MYWNKGKLLRKQEGKDNVLCARWNKRMWILCEAEIAYEIGPDESLEDVLDTAVLLEKIEGSEEVEKMDALLSLAITGGDDSWI